ncbi:1,4-alpha-glucan branching enzyme [Streptomyces sp. NPDC056669]|uniref:1,4-alpha-glucan branching enzyme n=1 Tax=Streptomyces sp. NPDC056669 TaxID=3345903 RepID=UPI003676F807
MRGAAAASGPRETGPAAGHPRPDQRPDPEDAPGRAPSPREAPASAESAGIKPAPSRDSLDAAATAANPAPAAGPRAATTPAGHPRPDQRPEPDNTPERAPTPRQDPASAESAGIKPAPGRETPDTAATAANPARRPETPVGSGGPGQEAPADRARPGREARVSYGSPPVPRAARAGQKRQEEPGGTGEPSRVAGRPLAGGSGWNDDGVGAEHGVRPAPALGDEERRRLLSGAHHAPHDLLGAHPVRGGVLFRCLRPYARSVTVAAAGLRARLRAEGDGLFSGVLPLREIPDYRLLVTYEDAELELHDPYRFLPTLGELDLHLIGEGRHEELWRALGAHPMTHQGVSGTRFTVWAPNALGVRLTGDFTYWDGTALPMRSLGGSGVWELFLPGVGEGALYKFEITRPDGGHSLRADPMARRTECPPATASVVHASHHRWGDEAWLARREGGRVHELPFSVYEVHLPSWRPGLTYRQLAQQLPAYVKDLGFTHVELMPVAEHPFGGSWGYQVTGFYAPTARLGTPDDFKHLVDALHQAGIGVLVDWVPAHFPKDAWALAEFDGRPLYEPADPLRAAHPDWGTLEFDYGRTEVRNFLVANAVYWCEEFHIDGLRVDAVASMLYLDYSREPGQWTPNAHGGRENLDAVAFLQEMNATVYRRCPGVITIAEESTAWDGVTRATHHVGPSGFGGLGFGLKWNMGWMHDSLAYLAHEPVHRAYHHHEMTFSMVYAYSENYVLPISHDEVVHGKRALVSKMPGDWWQQRADHRAYLGFMWAHPGKQLLFMGQEFAQGAEWSEAHGPDWWLLDPSYSAEPDHRGVRDLVRDLNQVYAATPALWQRDTDPEGFSWIEGDAREDNVFAFLRFDADGSPLLAISNFSPVVRQDYRIGTPEAVPVWREVLNTDDGRYGGGGVANAEPLKAEPTGWHGRPASILPVLPPLATIWLRPA